MTSSLSSHSTSASVSELSRLVTHTAVSSPKCNSEKRPLSNSVKFQTLFKWHRYCGILKIHIVRKINTGIRYEPVYRPALIHIKHYCLFLHNQFLFNYAHVQKEILKKSNLNSGLFLKDTEQLQKTSNIMHSDPLYAVWQPLVTQRKSFRLNHCKWPAYKSSGCCKDVFLSVY